MKTCCTTTEHLRGIGATTVAYVLASLQAAHDFFDLLDVPPHERRRPWGLHLRDAHESVSWYMEQAFS